MTGKNCKVCGEMFETNDRRRSYCSKDCALIGKRAIVLRSVKEHYQRLKDAAAKVVSQ